MWEVEVKTISAGEILRKHGLEYGGPAHRWFTSELKKLSDPYVPKRDGILRASAYVAQEGDAIIYKTPYARYLWYGKVMVDPKTGKACGVYTDRRTGNVVFYSRKFVKKVLTDRDIRFRYQDGGLAGARWVERCWIDNREALCKSLEDYIKLKGRKAK